MHKWGDFVSMESNINPVTSVHIEIDEMYDPQQYSPAMFKSIPVNSAAKHLSRSAMLWLKRDDGLKSK